jgi:hypothetical protein
MEYRGVEYTVVQGVERGVWKWTASVTNLLIMGKAPTKSAAMAAVERAIDKAAFANKGALLSEAEHFHKCEACGAGSTCAISARC